MDYVGLAVSLLPSVAKLIEDAINASRGDEQVAIGILAGILGTDEQNLALAAKVVGEAMVQKALGPRPEPIAPTPPIVEPVIS